ncbi:cadherin-like domain-containing protein [Gymnodinialimonas sp. 57CJ19]|uniref:cadherin-like domain-containing protein n=1 Tax=Gymnodinialimonas sp. 57CJ19 TaxID=3138498 RepID=UPI00313438D7
MTNFTDPANLDKLIGLWDFREGNETADTGLDDGIAQNGETLDNPPDGSNAQAASFGGGYLHVGSGSNSHPTVFDVNADANSSSDDEQFNLDRGTLEVQFIQTEQSGSSEDVILSRGEEKIDEDDEGFFEIRVTKYGEVEAYHNTNDGDAKVELSTSKDFFCPGDVVNVKYSFDVATGATLTVTNVTAGTSETITVEEPGLTFDLTDNDDEEFTFGARESDDGEYDKEFEGKIDYVALYTTEGGPSGPGGPDGIVDGEDFGEVMLPGYDDANAPTDGGGDMIDGDDGLDDVIMGNGGDDSIHAGLGDDTVFGGADNDTISGDQGDDLIIGDGTTSAPVTMVRESFEWDKAPDPNGPGDIENGDPITGFTQNTGNVDVAFSIVTADASVDSEFANNKQNVDDIVDDGSDVDEYSSLSSTAEHNGDREAYQLEFSDPVENVSFRVNDIDGDGVVKFTAYLDGAPVEFLLEGGKKLTLLDTDGVAGVDTADSQGDYKDDDSDYYSVLVTIPGPVDRIVIDHSQDGNNDSGINVTDVYFDAPEVADVPFGDDSLLGSEGDDTIYGDNGDVAAGDPAQSGGNDTLIGGEGDDALFGEGGDDTIIAGAGDDVTGGEGSDMIVVDADEIDGAGNKTGDINVDGSTEGTDNDTLDLTAFEAYRNLTETPDADGDSTSGTVEVQNGDGDWVNVNFLEIENLLLPDLYNEGPDAVDDSIPVDEDESVTFNPLANDSDPEGDPLTVTDISDPSNGTLTDNGDGTYTYEPNDDFNGTDSVTYTISDGNGGTDTATITFNVAPVNDAPDAVNDSVTTDEDTAITIDVLDNDTDVDGDPLEITGASVPADQGTVEIVGNELLFTPAENFNGPATISYSISDGQGGTDTAEVLVNVTPVNDDPVAVDDTASTMEDESVVIDLIGNDTDVDGDTLELASVSVDPALGTVVDNGDGTVTFTPAPDYNGPVTIDYTVSDGNGGTDDGQAVVSVGAVNDGPTAVDDSASTDEDTAVTINVIGNDTDPDGDTLEVVGATVPADQGTVVNNGDGTLTFTPAENYNGPAEITYTITDGNGGTDEGTVNVTVNPVNDDPVAVDDIETTDEDVAVVVDLLGNDTDVDGDTLELASVSVDPALGTVVDNGDGTVTFTPAPDYNGPVTIDYTVSDGNGGTDDGQAIVSVGAVNDSPEAEDDTASTDEDTQVIIDDVLDNDSDPDGDTLTIISATVPADQGTVTIDGDNLVFDPAENFNGDATITYTISDGNGGTDTADVVVTVAPVNDDPDAVDDADSTDFETAVEIDVLANDSDLDGDTLTVASISVPASEGTLAPTGTEGVYSFTPADGFEGTATVTYTISDGNGGTDTATHTIEVGADPTPPDGVVDGEDFAEDMGPGYDDSNLPTDGGGDFIDGPDGDDDIIEGNGGDDTINAGQGSDTVSGGTGDDSIVGGASDDGDDLSGDEGDDTLRGGGGDDTLDGGVGDDVTDGGTGDDDITGGDGADSVLGGDGNDTIDTSGSQDLLDAGWPGYGPIPAVAPDSDPDDDKDTVDGGAGDDLISTGDDADVINAGTGNDTVDAGIDDDSVQGGAGDDLLIGSEGNDTLSGGGGDDTIFGGLETPAPDGVNLADDGFGAPFGPDPDPLNNADLIDGGAGDDLIYGQDDADTITGGTGNDTIDGGVDDDSIMGGQGEDSIEGGHGQDFIQGNNDNDWISGGRGSDTLEGNAGDDTIIGGAGDSIIGGGGADSIFIDQDEVDENGDNDAAIFVEGNTFGDDNDTLDLTDFVAYRNLVETTDGDLDSTSGSVEVQNDEDEWVEVTFNEIENLLLPPKAPDGVVDGEEFGEVMDPGYDDSNPPTDGGGDIIDGPDGDDDSIRGNGGDDTINAGEGDDTVDGGDDDDSVRGGNGDDIVMGGDGDDTVRGEEGDDTVSGGDGDDSVTGGAGDDVLDGGAGDDSLTGGSGDDTIDGGLGDDTITGSTGADSITDMDGDNVINSDNPGSFNPDLGTPIPTAGGTGPFIIAAPDADPDDNKDTITTGAGDDTINAGDDADVIDAGDGDNVVDGGTDADTITTGSGDDSIVGGEGSDLINSGDGDDTIDGGVGNDLANFIDEPNDGFTGDPILNNGDDTINAGAGDDVVNGEDDNDLIDGGEGDDTLDGGIDDDTILGGEGDDVIIGGQGADSLDGGLGDDTFNVGTFTDPNGTGDYVEGAGDTIVGGEDPGDGDVDTLDLTGAGSLKVVYDDGIDPTGTPGESGTVIFYTDNTQSEEAGRLEFKEIENVIPCFTPGAMIATPRGEVPVETLREGDKVITRDNGIQEIRWTGNRTLNRTELAEGNGLKPILIKAGSLGRNLPERDMLVSPQHRVLITGETPQLYFEESEVLVAAKHLVGKQGVSVMDTMRTTYIHFMFDRHEVVLSDGAWTESFQPGDQTLGAMGEATREEILALFPELATEGGLTDYAAARRSLKAHEAKLLRL